MCMYVSSSVRFQDSHRMIRFKFRKLCSVFFFAVGAASVGAASF